MAGMACNSKDQDMDRVEERQGGGVGTPLLDNYRVENVLGRGSFAKVKRAVHVLTGQEVAIKILDRLQMSDTDLEKVRRETNIWSKLFVHPHIIRLYEVIETPTDIYVVMEYMSGDLFDYMAQKGRFQDDEARKFFQQIISGVEYCHRNMVAHRDLKPENILLDSRGSLKLADFGLSNIMRDGHLLKTSCGSPNYAAPEVISGNLYAGPEVDVWSCGVVLYALLCGTLPFDDIDSNFANIFKKTKAGIYTLPRYLSPGAKDLITRMLLVDPMKRITIPEIRQHQWFKVQLPRYLAVPAPSAMQHLNKVDEEIVHRVVRIGFDRNWLIDSLRNRAQNDATVAYYLLFDNRSSASNGYLSTELMDLKDYGSAAMHLDDVPHTSDGHRFPQHTNIGVMAKLPNEKKFHLGLQSPTNPFDIMTNILGALQKLNVRWKKIGVYNIKCLWLPAFHQSEGVGSSNGYMASNVQPRNILKFELQLYKTREGAYLLDLQRVSGAQLLFMEFCTVLIKQLDTRVS